MPELRCGTCGQLDYDELKTKYDKIFDYLRQCAEYGQCFESDGSHGHWINCHVNAEKLLKEITENG